MLLFKKYGISVYAVSIPATDSEKGPGRALAEKTAVKLLLREAFPHQPQLHICHTPSGAPYLSNGASSAVAPQAFESTGLAPELPVISISHCKEMAVLAVAPYGCRIGIDCETPDRPAILERVAPRFLSSGQMDVWGVFPAALWAWTIKEALYKAALRPGLPLDSIPLPLEIPLDNATDDGVVELHGHTYNIVQIDAAPFQAVVMLALNL